MAKLAREAVEAGAVGISTTRTMLHRAKDGELAAGTTAAADELIALGEALGGVGPPGVLGGERHARPRPRDRLDGRDLASVRTSRSRSRPCRPTSRPTGGAPGSTARWTANRAGRLARPAGGRASRRRSSSGSSRASTPSSATPPTRPIADLPLDERLAALRTPEVRDAILAEDVQPAGPEAFLFANFHKLFPLGDPPNYEPAPEDSVGAIAEREGRSPLEVAYDLMLQRDGHELLYLPILGYAERRALGHRRDAAPPGHRPRASATAAPTAASSATPACRRSCSPTGPATAAAATRSRSSRSSHHQTSRTAALYGFADRGHASHPASSPTSTSSTTRASRSTHPRWPTTCRPAASG